MYIILFFIILSLVNSTWTCFNDSNDEVKGPPTYVGTLTVIPLLGPLKLHSGGWDSQSAANAMFKILVQEKLGIEVEYYPPLEKPLNLSADFTHEWSPSGNTTYHYGNDTYPEYWSDYDRWCNEDDIHMFMYLNSFHVSPTKSDDDYATDITHLQNGVVEKQAFFIPIHVGEGFNWRLFNDTDFQAENALNDTSGKRIIYSSLPGYWMNEVKERQMRYFGMNETWEMKYTNSDVDLLYELMEMEARGDTYVYVSWAPSMQTSWFTSREMTARPVNFPYNPSGTQRDPCVNEGSCAVAEDIIQKGKCKTFTQVRDGAMHFFTSQLWENFKLSRTNMEEMIKGYTRTNYTMEESVCAWMKMDKNRPIWEPWLNITGLPEPTEEKFKTWEKNLTFSVVAIFVLLILCAFIMFLYFWQTQPQLVARLHPQLTAMWILSIALLMLATPFLVLDINVGNCASFAVLLQYALSFIFAIPALKAWRISQWFQKVGAIDQGITNTQLYSALVVVAIIDACIVVPYVYLLNKYGVKVIEENANTMNHSIDRSCNPDEVDTITFIIFIWHFLLVISLFYFAYRSRNAWDRYNEAKWLAGISLYSMGMLLFIAVLGQDSNISFHTWRKMNLPFIFLSSFVLLGTYIAANFWGHFQDMTIHKANVQDQDQQVDDIMMSIGHLTPEGLDLLRKKLKQRRELDKMTYETTVRSRKKADQMAGDDHLVSELLTKYPHDSMVSMTAQSQSQSSSPRQLNQALVNPNSILTMSRKSDTDYISEITLINESPVQLPYSASLEMETIPPSRMKRLSTNTSDPIFQDPAPDITPIVNVTTPDMSIVSPDYGPNMKLSSQDRQDSELLQNPNDSRTDPSLAQTPSERIIAMISDDET